MPTRAANEIEIPMQAVEVRVKCPECSEAEMDWKGIVLTVQPPLYPHRCGACGHEETYSVSYPFIEYQKID